MDGIEKAIEGLLEMWMYHRTITPPPQFFCFDNGRGFSRELLRMAITKTPYKAQFFPGVNYPLMREVDLVRG